MFYFISVSISSLILYARFRKRNARLRTASENLENFAESETTALVDDQETDKSEPLIGAINGKHI